MTDTYLVGFDGSESSQRAVDLAGQWADSTGAKIHLVQILEWSPYSFHTPDELAERHMRREQEIERAKATIQPAVKQLQEAGHEVDSEVRHGHAADLLCEIAKEIGAGQIIVGRTGGNALASRLLGSLAITLVQSAPVPVTIVP